MGHSRPKKRSHKREQDSPGTTDPTAPPTSVRPVARCRVGEKRDDYPKVVVRLAPNWRVIECREGLQWVLQRRKGIFAGGPAWKAHSFFGTEWSL